MMDIVGILIRNKELIAAVSGATSVTTLFFKFWPKVIVSWKERRSKRQLNRQLNAIDYTEQDIERAIDFYIDPECQVIDPSGAEDFRQSYPVRQNLFEVVDCLLEKPSVNKFSLILGDTGMGKTSFLLNYYARYWQDRRRQRKFSIKLIPLSARDALAQIADVANKVDTVLFLDALDEDTGAIPDHKERFRELIRASKRFRHILITCRTQFFSKDDEIPKDAAGIIRVGPIGPGDTREYMINKLYISPFSEHQIQHYLVRRFPFWRHGDRRKAISLVEQIEDLPARPMLLAQIESILSLGTECKYGFQVYEQMIQSWLNRESGIAQPDVLRQFCECLAVDIYQFRKERGAEKISESELEGMARRFEIQMPRIDHIRIRSLLNRDAQGNLKFSHRSILEYLFVVRCMRFPSNTPRLEWTDQMKRFYWEMSFSNWEKKNTPIEFKKEADLTGLEHLRIKRVLALRAKAEVMPTLEREGLLRLAQEFRSRVERAPHFYRTVEAASDRRREQPQTIIIDHALGLAWEVPGGKHAIAPSNIHERSTRMQQAEFGGFSNWRVPTIEEAFSLAHLSRYEKCAELFSSLGARVWTADKVGLQHLSVDLASLDIRVEGLSQPSGQWPRAVCVASTGAR
jgi:hypothetical protein